MLSTHRLRSERGAVALIVALSSMIIFGLAAIAVDLGNTMSRKRDLRSQADFAALAAGNVLGGSKVATDPAVVAVANYFNKNQPIDEGGPACVAAKTCVTAAALVDGNDANGEVYFSQRGNRLRVIAPLATVDMGLAGVFGANALDINAEATVAIQSPLGRGILPMYVARGQGCDYGTQTLTDPSGGQVVPPTVPPLAFDADTNDMKLDSFLPDNQVPLNAVGENIQIFADKYRAVTRVGFFRSDNTDPALVIGDADGEVTWVSPTTTPFTANNGSITVTIPTSVTSVETLWYVRLYQAGTVNKWSARSEALPLRVGEALIECTAGSVDGNFGTIKLPRTSTPATWIPYNIALGLEAPLSLAIFPRTPVPYNCSSADAEAIISTAGNLRPDTNCVDTDTGLTAETATEGFITGSGSIDGLLEASNSSTSPFDDSKGCAPGDSKNSVTLVPGHPLNNDLLTCYINDPNTPISTLASSLYNGGPLLHPDIYKSPRFAWVPVFTAEVVSGGSNMYAIADFRPVFITDQPVSATRANGATGATTTNGLGMSGNRLTTIKVVFFNPKALPPGEGDTPTGPYLGVGPKVIRLVD